MAPSFMTAKWCSINDVDVTGHGAEDVANFGSLFHRHDFVTVHDRFERLERVHFGDDDQRTHAARTRGETASAPAVTGDDEALACQQDVGGADDAVHGGLPRAVAVVEEMLGHGIVDGDDGELKHLVGCHGAQADDACGGLFGAADDVG